MQPQNPYYRFPSCPCITRSICIPLVLESPRLILRQFVNDDWRAMHELYGDPECTRFTFGRPLSEGESWRTMASIPGHWQLRGYGPYALEERATGALIGTAGLWYPNDWPEPEIKYALSRRYWGKGFATEAVKRVQVMVAEKWPGKPPISFINAENTASIKLAIAIGARLEQEVEFRGGIWHIYRHPDLADD